MKRERGTSPIAWPVSVASGAPMRPSSKSNMNSGVKAICSSSDRVEHIAGTRTLPAPRRIESKVPTVKLISRPPKRTRENSVA